VISEYEVHIPADILADIMINPLATGEDTSAALAVVKATVGQKVRYVNPKQWAKRLLV
jgi:hypothetical protein